MYDYIMQVIIMGISLFREARGVLGFAIARNVQIMLEALDLLKMTPDIKHGENVFLRTATLFLLILLLPLIVNLIG